MTQRSCTRFAAVPAVVASIFPLHGQIPAPAEIRALPPWSGEEAAAVSVPAHFVFLDSNGQIVISYPRPEGHGRRVTYRFWLPSRVGPRAGVLITTRGESDRPAYTYTYTLENRISAISPIVQWSIVGPAMQEITVGHPSWKGYNARVPVAVQALVPDAPAGAFLMWRDVEGPKLQPGGKMGEFTVRSLYSPGVTTAYASAAGVLEEPDGEFPEAVIRELIPLQRAHVWQKPFPTIGPRFAPGTLLSAIFDAFRKDVESLITQGLIHRESRYVRELQEVLSAGGARHRQFTECTHLPSPQ